MTLAQDLWLRGKAAQSSMMHLLAYNTAFAGTATIQAWKMGLTAPTGFWKAMARAGAANAAQGAPAASAKAKTARRKSAEPATAAVEAVPLPAVEPAPVPAARPEPEPARPGPSPHLLDAPRGGKADDLTALTGVGAKLGAALNEFGIYHFDQIATLDADGIDWLNEQQAGFKMLCARYNLVDQARARLA